MNEYNIKNFKLKHNGKEYLVYGKAQYTIETDAETGAEAVFEAVSIIDAIGFQGLITDRSILDPMQETLIAALNNDDQLSRMLGSGIRK
jgi:chitinase